MPEPAYVLILARPWMNQGGHGCNYTMPSGRLGSHKAAVREGHRVAESDDFNIGKIVDGRLVDLLWMHESLGENADTLTLIAGQIGVKPPVEIPPEAVLLDRKAPGEVRDLNAMQAIRSTLRSGDFRLQTMNTWHGEVVIQVYGLRGTRWVKSGPLVFPPDGGTVADTLRVLAGLLEATEEQVQ